MKTGNVIHKMSLHSKISFIPLEGASKYLPKSMMIKGEGGEYLKVKLKMILFIQYFYKPVVVERVEIGKLIKGGNFNYERTVNY